jgi:hypothetical protein
MKFNYDIRGNLYPNSVIATDWDSFEDTFVTRFAQESETRTVIFANFVAFIKRLQNIVETDFSIWVDGSFISKKVNPRDLDAVFYINYRVAELKKSVLDNFYFVKKLKYSDKLDLYYSIEYPENHKRHFLTHLNRLYWLDVYGNTRKDDLGQQYTKGFIELNINSTWKNS